MSTSSIASSLRSWPPAQASAAGRPVTASSDSLHRGFSTRQDGNHSNYSNFSEDLAGRSDGSLHLAHVLEWEEPTEEDVDFDTSGGQRYSFPTASDDWIRHSNDDPTSMALLGSLGQEHSKTSALNSSWRVADCHIEKMVRTLQHNQEVALAGAAAGTATATAAAAATTGSAAGATGAGATLGRSEVGGALADTLPSKMRPRPKSSTSSSCACRAMLGVGRVRKPMPAIQSHQSQPSPSSSPIVRSSSNAELRSVVKDGVVHLGGHHKYRAKAHRGHPLWEPRGPIDVQLHFHETNDRLTVQVDPKMWLDSDDGEMVIDDEVQACSLDTSQQPVTLKGIIERLSGIPREKQRLFCNKVRVEGCGLSLLDCGIHQESVVHIRSKQDASRKDRDKVVLASASRRLARDEAWASQRRFRCSAEPSDRWAQDRNWNWSAQSPAGRAGRSHSHSRLQVQEDKEKEREREERRDDSKGKAPLQHSQEGRPLHLGNLSGHAKVMPQWQPASQLKFFGPTHKGLDYHGDSQFPVHMFGDYHTWRPVEDDRHFGKIRTSLAYTTPIEYE